MTGIVERLLTEHLGTWTAAVETKSAASRGSSKKLKLVGIQKLRELILELAVRGQLVPQDENDEPASVLLERIAAEREQLVKEKKIKKPKKLPEISEDELSLQFPKNWSVVRLGNVMSVLNGRAYKKHEMLESGTPLLRVGNLFTSNHWYYSDLELEPDKYIDSGDLIYAWSASFGPFIWEGGRAIYHYHIWKLDLFNDRELSKEYLLNYLSSITRSIKASGNGIAMIHMTKERMEKLILPIPPLAEQKRIVAKVDELMALCDALEQEQESSIAAHGLLVENLLAALTNAASQGGFKQAWARVAEHFDALFTTEQSIEQLKQTILQLAVMGKLVEQDPEDEPAEVLLERIAAEKKRLVEEKVIKKQKVLPEISDEEKVFELPEGWAWCRFADLANDVATGPFGSMIHKRDYVENGIPLINPSHMVNSEIVEDLSISVSSEKAEELNSYTLFTSDIVMARRGEMGRCALVTKRENGWLCGTGSFVLRFQPELSRGYILLFFKTEWTKSYLGGKSIGTTMTNLNHGILNKMPLLIPPSNEQNRITKQVKALMGVCDSLKEKIIIAQSSQVRLAEVLAQPALS